MSRGITDVCHGVYLGAVRVYKKLPDGMPVGEKKLSFSLSIKH